MQSGKKRRPNPKTAKAGQEIETNLRRGKMTAMSQTAVPSPLPAYSSLLAPGDMQQLQRTIGNRAVGQITINQKPDAVNGAANPALNPTPQESLHHLLVNRKVTAVTPLHITPTAAHTQPGFSIQRASAGEIKTARSKLADLRKQLWRKSMMEMTNGKDLKEYVDQVVALQKLVQTCLNDADYFTSGVLEEMRNLIHDIIQANQLPPIQENTNKIFPTKAPQLTPEQIQPHMDRLVATLQNTMKYIPEQVSGELWETLAAWLDARLPQAPPDVKMKLIRQMEGKDGLEQALKQFLEHRQAEAGEETNPKAIGEKVETTILKSQTLGPLIADSFKKGSIATSFVVLHDDAFAQKHAEIDLEKNKEVYGQEEEWIPPVLQAAKIDNVLGFQYQGVMYIRQGESGLVTPIHEAIHQLGENIGGKAWHKELGHHMEEGAVEMLTLQVCDEIHVDASPETSGYYNEWTLLDTIMGKCSISQMGLKTAYLGGDPSPIVAAIREHSGEAGLAALRQKESHKAYYAWVDAYLAHKGITLEEANQEKIGDE